MSIDYAKLTTDLTAAVAEAQRVAEQHPDDGGTCNFDCPEVYLPCAREATIDRAARDAGIRAFRQQRGAYHFSVPVGAQGARRTIQAEAMAMVLAERGWAAHTYYRMD